LHESYTKKLKKEHKPTEIVVEVKFASVETRVLRALFDSGWYDCATSMLSQNLMVGYPYIKDNQDHPTICATVNSGAGNNRYLSVGWNH
jgi:hypothetical protein